MFTPLSPADNSLLPPCLDSNLLSLLNGPCSPNITSLKIYTLQLEATCLAEIEGGVAGGHLAATVGAVVEVAEAMMAFVEEEISGAVEVIEVGNAVGQVAGHGADVVVGKSTCQLPSQIYPFCAGLTDLGPTMVLFLLRALQ